MLDISIAELLTFGIIAIIVLGPEKLPQAVRTAGKYYAKFRRTISVVQAEIEAELDLAETRQKMQQELAEIKQAEVNMKQEMAQWRKNMRQFKQQQNTDLASTIGNNDSSTDSLLAAKKTQQDTDNQDYFLHTKPWENMWFKLGDYDKSRRLPAAPFLPNYVPDILLNSQDSSSYMPQISNPIDKKL